MELHNEENKLELLKSNIKNKENKNKDRTKTLELELVVKQQNIKISHLLEQIENLKTNNVYMTTLLEELLNLVSDSKEEKTLNVKNPSLDLVEKLVKFN